MAAITSGVFAWLGNHRRETTIFDLRWAERAAAAAAIGLLIASAAMPAERDASSPALAAASPVSTALSPGSETDFGVYLGAPYHHPSDFNWKNAAKNTDLTIKDVAWFTHPFENPLYYGVRIQHWLDGGRFGGMIDFTHSKAYGMKCKNERQGAACDPPSDKDYAFEGTIEGKPAPKSAKLRDHFDKLEWSHGHNMLTLNGLFRLPSLGIVSPYAGVGAGILLPHSEFHLISDKSRTYEYQFAGPVGQAVFGLEFRLAKGSVFVEYKFTLADYWNPLSGDDGSWLPLDLWRQFSRWWSGAEPRDGWAGARITSHQVIGGFLSRFVPKPATN